MLDVARKLTFDTDNDGRVDQYGIGGFGGWASIWGNGGDVLNEDYSRSLLAEPEAVEAVKFMVDLEKKYKVSPPISLIMARGLNEMFEAGKIAMSISYTWTLREFRKACNFGWDIALLPRGKVRAHWMSTAGHAISSQTKHPEEAWLLLKFLSSKEAQIMAMDSTVPTLVELNESEKYRSPLPPEHWHVFVEAIQTARSSHRIPHLRQIEMAMGDTFESAKEGKKTVREYCIDGAKRINRILQETGGQ